jgi:hypothetical protein
VLEPTAGVLCSLVSREAGEDAIGSAPRWDDAFVFLLPRGQWDAFRARVGWEPGRLAAFERIGDRLRSSDRNYALLLADPGGSPGGVVRHYRRPEGLFARYERHDYLLGPGLSLERLLTTALLEKPGPAGLVEHRLPSEEGSDLHVCVHGSVDAACGREGYPLYSRALADGHRCWRTGHIGGHRFAPTALELPGSHYWGRLTPDLVGNILARRGPIEEAADSYRGWAALDYFAQLADAAALREYGWGWLDTPGSARTLETIGGDGGHPGSSENPPGGALVQVDYRDSRGGTASLAVSVERLDTVLTKHSTRDTELRPAHRYRVTQVRPTSASPARSGEEP